MGFQVLFAFDSDTAGQTACERAGLKLNRYTGPWQLANWGEFDELPPDVQADAWRFLSIMVSDRSTTLADTQGIVEAPLSPPKRTRPRREWKPQAVGPAGRDLDLIPVEDYVHALTGQEIDTRRPSCCPLPDHDDQTASFHAYENGSWICYGCDRGGRIFDLAAAVWGIHGPLRGDVFRDLRSRLQEVFG
jgi:hypothetical protein